jgi:hypothetical protein
MIAAEDADPVGWVLQHFVSDVSSVRFDHQIAAWEVGLFSGSRCAAFY